ncbi:hypothetical protein GCM10007071_07320 [Marinobacter zhanjiangensis]|uniref:Uncharacterized protein n=2 Tax=Marinobacter zhanjiangensis TaxID=578215 RepID=A0ABQ3ANX9_9GAMM|nr:hypothetical protein GCM10007071_07320 [Marinobacter zhanjiangensis]
MFLAALLYVIFGQVTVRRLRKNPEVRDKLGMELASGWDILNVAGALSRPHWLSLRLRKSRLSFTAADERPIYAHTNWFDRFLGRLFFYTWIGSVIAFLFIGTIAHFGLIE